MKTNDLIFFKSFSSNGRFEAVFHCERSDEDKREETSLTSLSQGRKTVGAQSRFPSKIQISIVCFYFTLKKKDHSYS